MKKTTIALACLAIVLSASQASGAIRVESMTSKFVSDPQHPFEGNILFSAYYYFNKNIPSVSVTIANEAEEGGSLVFTGEDLSAGLSFMTYVGKPLVVEFSDAKYTVAGVFTYDPKIKSSTSLKTMHANFAKHQHILHKSSWPLIVTSL